MSLPIETLEYLRRVFSWDNPSPKYSLVNDVQSISRIPIVFEYNVNGVSSPCFDDSYAIPNGFMFVLESVYVYVNTIEGAAAFGDLGVRRSDLSGTVRYCPLTGWVAGQTSRNYLRGVDLADCTLFSGDSIYLTLSNANNQNILLRVFGYAVGNGFIKIGNLSSLKW